MGTCYVGGGDMLSLNVYIMLYIIYSQFYKLYYIIISKNLQYNELENIVPTGFINVKRDRGKQHETFMTYLEKMTKHTHIELIRSARNRKVWKKFVRDIAVVR